ncbi:MAG: M2 family metallopeptidase [Deltaproteobacteria bacterium]|nr:M2 family metallopeptidase [Deltaproteobacteria bacterium]
MRATIALAGLLTAIVAAAAPPPGAPRPTRAEAAAFLRAAEDEIGALWIARERANWVRATFITEDTEALAARAEEAVMEASARLAREAVRFAPADLAPADRRKLDLLRLTVTLPPPPTAPRRAELAAIATRMENAYSKGKHCPPRLKGKCLTLDDISRRMAKSRKPDELLELWRGWHAIAPPLRADYRRYVELANEGARGLGFKDVGDQWRSRYDMKPAEFEALADRLLKQLQPLYQQLHCHVRAKLRDRYGAAAVPEKGPIPAHLLGNMWAQEWTNVYGLVTPRPAAKSLDLNRLLKARKTDARGMVKYAEGFFVSLGLTPLPKSFWDRSMLTRPRDREVVCHASAWAVDYDADIRIKMCIEPTGEDFTTIHHELGHNYYQFAYRRQPMLFRDSANDGFHEALGDTIALSVTPGYLARVGLLKPAQATEMERAELNDLMQRALEKIAFLPFGYLVDRWRWGVFSGRTPPSGYNAAWWRLRRDLQGVSEPVPRSEADFDPGAKYHVPSNVPYARYFLASFLQFQFHRALCKTAGHEGPLNRCSIYGSKAAGAKLQAMMEMGQSRPWPEALRALTGEDRLDAGAMLEYFKPLHDWLAEQNRGRTCGW